MRLDLACGLRKREGFLGVDASEEAEPDFLLDLNRKTWPFGTDTVSEIWCSHFVEHVESLIHFMDEAWRISRNGAKMTILAPYYTSIRAWQDPTHVRAISEATWPYFDAVWRKASMLSHYPIQSDFEIVSVQYAYNPRWQEASDEIREAARLSSFNVVDDILVELVARKPAA